jgi:hypothetical protein
MANFINNLNYSGARNFYEVLADVNVELPRTTTQWYVAGLPAAITKLEESIKFDTAEIGQMKGRITSLESSIKDSNLFKIASRVVATAALVFSYILLAATLIGIPAIILLETECRAFESVSQGLESRLLRRETRKLQSYEYRLGYEEKDAAALKEFRAKVPEIIRTLEERVDLLKRTEEDLLANAKNQPLWHAMVGNNARVRHQYEYALECFKKAM